MTRFSESQISEYILKDFQNKKIAVLAPVVKGRKGHYRELFEQTAKQGFVRMRIDGVITELRPKMQVDRYKVHDIEVVIDRLKIGKKYTCLLYTSDAADE